MGRIACWLALTFVAWFVVNQSFVVLTGIGDSLEGVSRLPIIVFGLAGLACGLAASVAGFLAIVRQKERSILVFATMLPGLFVLVFALGELLVPH